MTGESQPSEYERVKIFSLVKDEDGSISRVPKCLCELCRVNHFICPRYATNNTVTTSAEKVLDERMIAWIRNGERGISSEVIFEVLANHPLLLERYDFSTPSDASDFNRCFELIRAIPEWEERLNEVSEKHRHWKLIVEHWQELTSCLIKDIVTDGRSCICLLNKLNKYRYAPEKYPELRERERG